jgi:histidinol-phosphate aminotransferase
MTNVTNLVRPNIVSLKPYSSARDEFQGSEGVFLDANENPFGSLNRYPDPYQKKLKQQISTIKGVDVENIFLGNGSDEVLDLCFRIFCEPGIDKALLFVPTYGMYEVAAQINNVALIEVPLNTDFQIDETSVLNRLDDENLKMIIICSPNNPTGNTIDNVELILENFKGIVVVDEAYIDFSQRASLAAKIDKYPNLIVVQTLSKAWGIASARVGMAFANPEIISYLNKVKPPYNISTGNQDVAMMVLNEQQLFNKRVNSIIKERDIMIHELENLSFVEKLYPTDANFILVQVTDALKVYTFLVDNKVIVRDRSNVINNCLRITIGTPEENKLLLQILKEIKL